MMGRWVASLTFRASRLASFEAAVAISWNCLQNSFDKLSCWMTSSYLETAFCCSLLNSFPLSSSLT